jgi:hypothetical protein
MIRPLVEIRTALSFGGLYSSCMRSQRENAAAVRSGLRSLASGTWVAKSSYQSIHTVSSLYQRNLVDLEHFSVTRQMAHSECQVRQTNPTFSRQPTFDVLQQNVQPGKLTLFRFFWLA